MSQRGEQTQMTKDFLRPARATCSLLRQVYSLKAGAVSLFVVRVATQSGSTEGPGLGPSTFSSSTYLPATSLSPFPHLQNGSNNHTHLLS